MQIKQIKVGHLETNCYLLITSKEILIIDPGGDHDKILQNIQDKTKKHTIVNTHYHFDHTLANNKLREVLSAKVLIHKDEKSFVDFKIDQFLKEGELLEIGGEKLEVIHTPGHTQGSICLLGNNFIFTGDTLFKNGYGRTDLPGGSPQMVSESLKKLNSLIKKGTKIYPGHGDTFYW